MAAKAAAIGSGVVMGDLALCREDFAAGTLVRPFPEMTCPSPQGDICLIGLAEKWHEPKVAAFRGWTAEVAAEEAAALRAGTGEVTR